MSETQPLDTNFKISFITHSFQNLHGSFQPNRAPLAKYEDSDDESNKLNSSQTETKTLEYYFDPPHHNEPSEIEAHYVAKPTTPPIDIKGSSKSLQGGTPSKMRSMKDSIKGIRKIITI